MLYYAFETDTMTVQRLGVNVLSEYQTIYPRNIGSV